MTTIINDIPDPAELLKTKSADQLGIDDWHTEEAILDILDGNIGALGSPKTIKRIAALMAKVPLFADAYIALGDPDLFPREYLTILDRGIAAGAAYIDASCIRPVSWWGDMKTRSYMRAKATRAHHLILRGEIDEALLDLHDLLDTNPNDNQGIRTVLIATLLNEERWNEAEAAIRLYGNDETISRYASVLISWRSEAVAGNFHLKLDKTEDLLKRALALNAIVPSALAEPDAFAEVGNHIVSGGASEACWTADAMRHAWGKNRDAIHWMSFASRKILNELLAK